jgi:uncharacterized protein (TIGR03435 family)
VILAQNASSRPTFEVTTIRRSTSRETTGGGGYVSYGHFRMTNVDVRTLMRIAYRVDAALAPSQIVDGPEWTGTDTWDITATTGAQFAGTPAGRMMFERRLLLQSLLEDRFKLKAHRESRELDYYVLVRARPNGDIGSQIRPARDCSPADPACSVRVARGRFSAGRVPLAALVSYISRTVLKNVIVDRTGLNGIYDLSLEWSPDASVMDKPSIFVALQEQLGLKLETERGPVDVVVIDHVELPVED